MFYDAKLHHYLLSRPQWVKCLSIFFFKINIWYSMSSDQKQAFFLRKLLWKMCIGAMLLMPMTWCFSINASAATMLSNPWHQQPQCWAIHGISNHNAEQSMASAATMLTNPWHQQLQCWAIHGISSYNAEQSMASATTMLNNPWHQQCTTMLNNPWHQQPQC